MFGEKFPATKSVGTGEAARFPAKILDRFYDLAIDLSRQNAINNLCGRRICHTITVHELSFHARFFESTGNALPATVHNRCIPSHRFKKSPVARDAMPFIWIARVHETAAVLHE